MQFKITVFSTILTTLASISYASPIGQRDVFVPRIISPDNSTVWVAGSTVNVTWDASNAPAQISNRASVQLNKQDPRESLGKLAQDFDLRAGFVEITVPSDLAPASDYFITLFGDSGNWSPEFSVVAPEDSTSTSSLEARDVWSPHITSPESKTVWVTGSTVTVTWDTSDAPTQISNGAGVQLNKAGLGQQMLKEFRSFELTDGKVEVVVPDVEEGDDYSITLFGDSGNRSEEFTIAKA